MSTVKNYLSLVKFSHTIFALPFALIGFALGMQYMGTNHLAFENIGLKFFLVLVCMVTARSTAMAFNRYLDRHFDQLNPRTAIREIPAGIIKAEKALLFIIINAVLFITATYFINPICFYLSPVALFVIMFYSYTKRFTFLCHLVLGIGLSLAPIGAYLAVTGVFHILPLLFSFAVVFWVSGFDVIYALQDIDFDQSQQLYSIPSYWGLGKALNIARGLHIISASFVIAAYFIGDFHLAYLAGLVVFVGMLIYQHSIVKPNDLSKVNIAFMTANGIASIVFSTFVISDILMTTFY
ncbi:MAG: putative 4-hydroxybenzoate polyprenyltransferase [Sediminibacterium sp.]|jgi:4-hydroxybenzoate polyprenyltransferase|nr:putative 4-hydroxybenzoate polyprenyltransferase [Sediminibacterium sp.]